MNPIHKRGLFALFAALFATVAAPAHAQAIPTLDPNQYGQALIGAPAAWALGYNGTGVTVAVGDSGIQTTHPAFAGKIDPRSMNFRLQTNNGPYDPADYSDNTTDSHGTHVAGIIASSAASNVPGVAYGAGLVVLRLTDNCKDGENCSAPNIPNASATAIQYFAGLQNVMLYNASYGPDSGKNQTVWAASTIDPDEEAAIVQALGNGKIIVAANGNDRETNPIAGVNPNGIALYPFVRPANANTGVYTDGGKNIDFSNLDAQPGLIVAVTSVGQDKTIAYYAQTCGVTASWCVAAPGGDQKKDNGVYSTLPVSTFGYLQGTSMAAPMTTGALAVLQQAYPTYAARDLANALFATAENIGGTAGDNATYGYGLIRLDRAVAGPTTLAAGTAVNVDPQTVTYWSQPLTTSGGFSKTGTGYLIVAGRTTAAGDVTVNAGALGVDGTLTLQTQMTVANGASLSGFGRIVGNTTIAGTLDAGQLPNYADVKANSGGAIPAGIPLSGASPGTLTFQGNVTLTGTATMVENIDGSLVIPGGPGTFDKVIVTGNGATFTAGGTLAPTLRNIVGGNNTYSPPIGTRFLIVSAQGGAAVAGQFASLSQPAAGLAANSRLDVVYTATGITLNVTAIDLSQLATADKQNKNVQNVADALDVVRPAPGIAPRGAAKAVFDDFYDDTEAEYDAELISLSGEGTAANLRAGLGALSGLSDTVGDRQGAGALSTAPQAASLSDMTDMSVWVTGYGAWSRVGDDGLSGAHTGDSGIVAGIDARLGEDLRAGAAFGYARTLTNSADAHADQNSYAAVLYATWTPGAYDLEARFAAGPTDASTVRAITVGGVTDIAHGSAGGWGGFLTAKAGYRFDAGDATLEPFAQVGGTMLQRDAYTETTLFGLSFPGQTATRVTTALGFEAATDVDAGFVTLGPRLRLAWTHDFGDDGLSTHTSLFGAPFEIFAAEPGRDAGVVRADIDAWSDGATVAFVGYTGEFRRNGSSHEVHGGVRLPL